MKYIVKSALNSSNLNFIPNIKQILGISKLQSVYLNFVTRTTEGFDIEDSFVDNEDLSTKTH